MNEKYKLWKINKKWKFRNGFDPRRKCLTHGKSYLILQQQKNHFKVFHPWNRKKVDKIEQTQSECMVYSDLKFFVKINSIPASQEIKTP